MKLCIWKVCSWIISSHTGVIKVVYSSVTLNKLFTVLCTGFRHVEYLDYPPYGVIREAPGKTGTFLKETALSIS